MRRCSATTSHKAAEQRLFGKGPLRRASFVQFTLNQDTIRAASEINTRFSEKIIEKIIAISVIGHYKPYCAVVFSGRRSYGE